jgi:hypothetical protein
MNDMQPGQTIVPHDPEEPKLPPTGAPEPERPVAQPDPVPAPSPSPEPAAPPTGDWKTTVGLTDAAVPFTPADTSEINWTAAEFIEHSKSPGWYAALAGITIVLVAIVYLISRDRLSTGVVLLVMIGFGFYAAHRPGVQEYGLSAAGIRIGNKVYKLQDFKTFSVTDEGSVISVVFMPLKRFMPPLAVYVTPEIENQVINFLSTFLPFDPHHVDATENLMRRIRF